MEGEIGNVEGAAACMKWKAIACSHTGYCRGIGSRFSSACLMKGSAGSRTVGNRFVGVDCNLPE